MRSGSPRFLVIRRDNIGDLVCTTPLLRGLRQRYPTAYIAVLASSYNRDILDGNPDIDDCFVFLKRQQKSHGHGLLATLWRRWQLDRQLRARRFDYVLLANGGWRYARRLGGKALVGFRERDNPDHQQPDIVVPLENGPALHEVEKLAQLAAAVEVPEALGPLRLFPDAALVARLRDRLVAQGLDTGQRLVGIHISSRRPQQRWPIAAFAEFMRRVAEEGPTQFLLFWSPGAENDPMHPGDDGRAAELIKACAGLSVFPCTTHRVGELVATLSLCGQMVCSDGGALHVAAGLGKPILCFFGDSITAEWRPWGVPYRLLQPASKVVADIPVDDAIRAWQELLHTAGE